MWIHLASIPRHKFRSMEQTFKSLRFVVSWNALHAQSTSCGTANSVHPGRDLRSPFSFSKNRTLPQSYDRRMTGVLGGDNTTRPFLQTHRWRYFRLHYHFHLFSFDFPSSSYRSCFISSWRHLRSTTERARRSLTSTAHHIEWTVTATL